MYILKNALISITRNKGRNLLIGIIILVIACSVSVTLAINSASNSLIESYEAKYEVEATIGINRENMMKDFNPNDRDNSREKMSNMFSNANNIETSDIEKYAESEYVKSYYYTVSVGVNSDTLEKASIGNDDNRFDKSRFRNQSNGDFTIKGYSSIDAMNEFIEGSFKITDGEVSEDFESNNCLINSDLATLNNIKVGDTIKVKDPNNNATYELKVSGIFEEKDDNESGMNMFSNSVNTIITNSKYVLKMKENNTNLVISTSPTFILNNKNVIDKFEKELQDKGLNENLKVETNLDQIKNSTSAISNVKSFSTTFLIITLIIGTIVLLVINMINIRERKYEIGVLRTIGMKKKYVSLQFITELLIVSLISLMLGAGVGATISVPVSNSLLKSEISSSINEQNNIRENFGKPRDDDNISNRFGNMKFKGVAAVQAFDSINATVNLNVLMELLGIGLLLTLISSISAISSIQKFSPLTILKERT